MSDQSERYAAVQAFAKAITRGNKAERFAEWYGVVRKPGESDDDLLDRTYAKIRELGMGQ